MFNFVSYQLKRILRTLRAASSGCEGGERKQSRDQRHADHDEGRVPNIDLPEQRKTTRRLLGSAGLLQVPRSQCSADPWEAMAWPIYSTTLAKATDPVSVSFKWT